MAAEVDLAAEMASIQTRMDSEVAQLRSQLECEVGKSTTAGAQHAATQADLADKLANASGMIEQLQNGKAELQSQVCFRNIESKS